MAGDVVAPGALVMIDGKPEKWAVQSLEFGGDWQCIRALPNGLYRTCFARPGGIAVVDTPPCAPGDSVRVGEVSGVIEGVSGDAVAVRLAPVRKKLIGPGFIMPEPPLVIVPLWRIVAENKTK